MSRIKLKLTVVGVLGSAWILSGSLARADDWPSYRGPRRNCTSTETGLMDVWPEGGPKLLWEAKLEPGNSSTVIANGRVFCLGRKGEKGWNHPPNNKPDGPVLFYCLDRTNGKILWTHEIPLFFEPGNTAMNTPTVDGERVYARGGSGNVHCVSVQDGKLLWTWPKDENALKKHGMYQGTTLAPDVLIAGDLAIFCDVGSGYNCGQTLIAANKLTGEIAWQYKRSMGPAYDTLKPELITVDTKRYLLLDHFALDIPTGKEVLCWGDKALTAKNDKSYTRGGETGFIGYANAVQDNMAYMNFCRATDQAAPQADDPQKDAKAASKPKLVEHGLLAMRFEHDKSGALTATKQWEWPGERGSWVNSPVLGAGCLFMNLGKDGSEIVCLDSATGKECWKYRISRLPNVHCLYSEPLFADGKVFLSTTDVVMIAADTKAFRMLGRAPLGGMGQSSGGGGTYHAPALSEGQLFARNNTGSVFCFDIRKETAEGRAQK
ncbi:MAG: PQQ-binding-like beta-propeller repeat protein [Planctomycetes bacterium]|nr:PQQ-binding-like beta-propeller repeat protein [Planctomycetota bacterium]